MTTTEQKGYTVDQVIEVIEQLSHSQGFYQRLLNNVLHLKENEPETFEEFKEIVEAQNFKENLDVILFFEG